MWLTDTEIDDLCCGLSRNAAKVRHLQGMGLVVNTKPNGRPLVVRSHAEAVLSGVPVPLANNAGKPDATRTGDVGALVQLFKGRRASTA